MSRVIRMKHFADGHTEEIIEERPDPVLDLKAVEAWVEVLTDDYDILVAKALLALLLETRILLTDLLPIADGVPPIAVRIRAVLAKASEGQP